MELFDEFEPIVMLNDGETFTRLGGCQLILLTQEEAESVTDMDVVPEATDEIMARTFDLEALVRWAFAHGYRKA